MKRKYALLVGRFQPLHEGHIALITNVLDQNKYVMIGIRDTEIDKNNPYTFEERKKMIEKEFGKAVSVTRFPDIDKIVVGRDVGYEVVRLSVDMEEISGTCIRETLRKQGELKSI